MNTYVIASKKQFFQNTVLVINESTDISSETSHENVVAIKDGKIWK